MQVSVDRDRGRDHRHAHRRYVGYAGFETEPPRQFVEIVPRGVGAVQRCDKRADFHLWARFRDPGERSELSCYDRGSRHQSPRASSGLARQPRRCLDVTANEHLMRTNKTCRPHYEAVYAHRLKPAGSAA